MKNSSIILRDNILVISISMVLSLAISTVAVALPSNKSLFIKLHKVNPNKPASKFEVISSVKKKFTGRILSVRKRYKAYGNDCHHVKFIDRKGKLLLIRVGCKKSKKK